MTSSTDRIEKQVLLRASRQRVWRALTQSAEFGTWFGMQLEGDFLPNTTVSGRMVPTRVDPDVAAQQRPFEGMPVELFIERVEPMRLFSFRWHPYPVEGDTSQVPTTLVTFELDEAEGGTLLRLSESGFDQIPIERRAEAFSGNEEGWEIQTRLIGKYLAEGHA
ncbi:MAG TPA: SRPBCC family protein [Polyangiaceae bacterium]